MPTYSFRDARRVVIEAVTAARKLQTELVPLESAAGRVLAEALSADRDYPPVARSLRDGFAVRTKDLPGTLTVAGEVRAGGAYDRDLRKGQCVEIMTGAPIPRGADAVVMVETVKRDGASVLIEALSAPGEFINPAGSEAHAGQTALAAGYPLGYAQIALLATFGHSRVRVYQRPRVAILATGDEVVPVEVTPQTNQVRNSNSFALAAQVARAGGIPIILPVAKDDPELTRHLIDEGLSYDLLLLSGGVSAGKYDYVEPVLKEFGAEFYFDRVLIQPGQPLVFGKARQRFFFGHPGNPASTMVTFEVLARAAVELLAGHGRTDLYFPRLRLTEDCRHKPGLTRFLPARVNSEATEVTPVEWRGSSDVPALARANAFLVCEADTAEWKTGETIGVLLQ